MKIENVKPELPKLKIPLSLIIDDSVPCINPLWYFRSQVNKQETPMTKDGRPMVKDFPADFVDRFADIADEHGIQGKFTVLPYPAGLGSIADGLSGYDSQDVESFISTVTDRLTPLFDITPEILTHTLALNLKDFSLLEDSEHGWSQKQNRETLAEYIERSIEILHDVDISPNGVTSPCDFGREVEKDYALAVLDAEKAANDRSLTWYFLHFGKEELVPPRLTYVDKKLAEAVVSVVAGCGDFFWETMDTPREDMDYVNEIADKYLTSDGSSGRVMELFNARSYIVLCTHWQSLYSNGTGSGLRALEEATKRIEALLGDQAQWMKCSEIARYRAASQMMEAESEALSDSVMELRLWSPFDCPDMTISFSCDAKPTQLLRGDGGALLKMSPSSGTLQSNSWTEKDANIILCCDLKGEALLRLAAS